MQVYFMKACHLFFMGKHIINIPDLEIQRCYLYYLVS